MQRLNIEQGSEDWHNYRKGRIGGSKLKDLIVKRGTERKIGFYQLIADKLGISDEGNSSSRERGLELEEEARQHFEDLTGKKTEKGGVWESDIDGIYVSPDVEISDTEAGEIKVLSSANHLKAIIEDKIPNEYYDQALQYFVVNPQLEVLYFIFYDPRITARPMHVIEMHRTENLQKMVSDLRQKELDILEEVNRIVEELAF